MNQLEMFLLAAVVMAFITSLLMRRIKHPYLYAAVALFGVVLHEATHAICGFIFTARPVKVSLIPTKNLDGGWTLGSVTCTNLRWYNAFPVAMAPLLLFLAPIGSYYLIKNMEVDYLLIGSVLILNMIITHTALPSRQDFRVAFGQPFGSFLWMAGLAYLVLSIY
jgi:hypothetical protein